MKNEIYLKEIVEKYTKGECSAEELKEALELFENPYHNLALRPALYEQWNKTEKEELKKLKKKDRLSVLNKIHRHIHLGQENKSFRNALPKVFINVLKVAAVLIPGLVIGLFIHYYTGTEPLYYTSIAPNGSISQIILPDNTMVFLNSGSQLKYLLNNKQGTREVFLEGEAWFEVEKNKKKPFIVQTPFYSIKVMGTQFNVKAYKTDEEIVTTLEDGEIEILSSENLKMNGNKKLNPGQQLIYNHSTGTMRTVNVKTPLFTSWKENKLIFINMNLKELIVLLERKYGVEIEVSDNIILDYHYDGTIKNETILEVLELIKETLPVQYKIEGQNIVIQIDEESNKLTITTEVKKTGRCCQRLPA